MKSGVYITFDVECSMGGAWGDDQLKPVPPRRAVMGQYGNREFGLPLITDILQQHDLAGTFFVEAFMAEQGYPAEAETICKYLLDRGQDVQLHIHPCNTFYHQKQQGKEYTYCDMIDQLPAEQQHRLLTEGAARIERWTGRPTTAFRAGNMSASPDLLKQVSAAGIKIDSSYGLSFVGGRCRFNPDDLFNGSRWYGDVLELALSGFTLPRIPVLHRTKPLDLVGISFAECRNAIRNICTAGADAVVILHSFSLFKVRNYQYDGGRLNRIVTSRFKRLCRWLSEHRDQYPTYTFSELATAVARGDYAAKAVAPCRLSGTRAVLRKAVQVYNNFYWT
jgi:peptidoglycan/xylan/chitin deacetylase (PgdA/CDA1 family)